MLNLSLIHILFTRQYLGVYDPTTSAVVNPVTGTPTATMVQYGLALIPEYVLRALASMEVFTKIEPTLYGEVYSAEIKTDVYKRQLLVPLNENYKLIFSNHIKEKMISSQVEVQFLNFAKNMPKDMHDDIPDSVHGAVMKLSQKTNVTHMSDVYIAKRTWR